MTARTGDTYRAARRIAARARGECRSWQGQHPNLEHQFDAATRRAMQRTTERAMHGQRDGLPPSRPAGPSV